MNQVCEVIENFDYNCFNLIQKQIDLKTKVKLIFSNALQIDNVLFEKFIIF